MVQNEHRREESIHVDEDHEVHTRNNSLKKEIEKQAHCTLSITRPQRKSTKQRPPFPIDSLDHSKKNS